MAFCPRIFLLHVVSCLHADVSKCTFWLGKATPKADVPYPDTHVEVCARFTSLRFLSITGETGLCD